MKRDVENGNYARIHNHILEAMAQADFTIREYKCLLFLLRKTYGWNRKEDAISLMQWEQGTGLSTSAVAQTLAKLEKRNVITRERSAGGRSKITVYAFNKYFEQWQTVSAITVSVATVLDGINSVGSDSVNGRNSVGSVKKTVSVATHTKDSKDNTTTNVVAPVAPDSYQEQHERLKNAKNKAAEMMNIYLALYPNGVDKPSYGYIGKVAKEVGGWGRLHELLWQNAPRPPSGDVLAYILKTKKNKSTNSDDNRAVHTLRFDN